MRLALSIVTFGILFNAQSSLLKITNSIGPNFPCPILTLGKQYKTSLVGFSLGEEGFISPTFLSSFELIVCSTYKLTP
jgi:hypothetical protein